MTFSVKVALKPEKVKLEGDTFQCQRKGKAVGRDESQNPELTQGEGLVQTDLPLFASCSWGREDKAHILCSPKSQEAEETNTQ